MSTRCFVRAGFQFLGRPGSKVNFNERVVVHPGLSGIANVVIQERFGPTLAVLGCVRALHPNLVKTALTNRLC